MKLKMVLIAAFFLLPLELHADGAYINLSIIGSDLDGPKLSSDTEGHFGGVSITPSIGFKKGPIRYEVELFKHSATALFHPDEISTEAYLFNIYFDHKLSRRFGISFGVGVGKGDVDVNITTCLELSGCPAGRFTRDSGSARITQFSIGITYVTREDDRVKSEYFLGFRQLKSGSLGLVDSLGTPYSTDKLDMPMAFFGVRWYF